MGLSLLRRCGADARVARNLERRGAVFDILRRACRRTDADRWSDARDRLAEAASASHASGRQTPHRGRAGGGHNTWVRGFRDTRPAGAACEPVRDARRERRCARSGVAEGLATATRHSWFRSGDRGRMGRDRRRSDGGAWRWSSTSAWAGCIGLTSPRPRRCCSRASRIDHGCCVGWGSGSARRSRSATTTAAARSYRLRAIVG